MFEAGKKYRRMITPKAVDPTIIEVLHATERSAHIRIVKGVTPPFGIPGCEHCYQQSAFEYWEEYKEPVVEKITRGVCFRSDGNKKIYLIEPNGPNLSHYYQFLSNLEFTVTDDKLTDVRIL